uniref:Uncharacterized protein n=1 Tax=Anopheles quadriannulatus TaxID=34691 RepID=A0A182XRP8_ANOQN
MPRWRIALRAALERKLPVNCFSVLCRFKRIFLSYFFIYKLRHFITEETENTHTIRKKQNPKHTRRHVTDTLLKCLCFIDEEL